MTTTQRPGFGRRFWRALIRLLAIVTTLAILAAMGVGGYLGFMELQRSFDTVRVRMDAMDRTVELLRSDVNGLMGEGPEQISQAAAMKSDIGRLDIRVTNLETGLAEDLAQQQTVLETLTTDVETAVTTGNTLTGDVAALNSALTALQSDINENGSQIDALGGEIDGLRAGVEALDTSIVTLNEQQAALVTGEEDGELNATQRTLALFRVWELITRARLRLLENNAGLASTDIETAIRIVDALVVLDPDAEALQMVQARLVLAFGNLPDNPELAMSDLEAAWGELDALFAAELMVGVETAVPAAEASASAGEDVAATETPVPETTPTATETPVPTPTATSQP